MTTIGGRISGATLGIRSSSDVGRSCSSNTGNMRESAMGLCHRFEARRCSHWPPPLAMVTLRTFTAPRQGPLLLLRGTPLLPPTVASRHGRAEDLRYSMSRATTTTSRLFVGRRLPPRPRQGPPANTTTSRLLAGCRLSTRPR
ncbi:hypothetical protein GUJ93_ZPchr0006g45881 [Zizania palustris]|uniref:Uncharacterized protein n=1 Tax=Zizania palustris TaxID=103762 RepID=A0A8J5SIC7_ZIZPA|nr:hypothetical protein GUJ93_ZPchr0006g45881 [Zizania palustris]